MKLIFKIALVVLSFISISSQNSYNEIEYRQRIISKYDHSFTFFSVKFIRDKGIQAKYQEGIAEFSIDPDNFDLIDETGDEGLVTLELTNEELGLNPIDKLFDKFDKIEFPEETDFTDSMFPDFPIWHIIVDGTDYKSNVNTDFYDEINEIVNIKKIKKHVYKLAKESNN